MSEITITDNQRAVLHAAAHSANLVAWPVPPKLGLSKGSAAIVVKGLLKKGLVEERPALGSDPVWREEDDGRKFTVVITKAGMAAIGMLPDNEEGQAPNDAGAAGTANASITTMNQDQPRMPRPGSKLAILVGLLAREEGATVEEMVAATGWQAHSVRGVMSGALAKKFGMRIVSEKIEGRGRTYKGGTRSEACRP